MRVGSSASPWFWCGGRIADPQLLALKPLDPGFRSDHVLVVDASFPMRRRCRRVREILDLLERVRAIPGVVAAGTVRTLPIDSRHSDGHFFIEGKRARSGNADAG